MGVPNERVIQPVHRRLYQRSSGSTDENENGLQ